jgi:hypothetical protein
MEASVDKELLEQLKQDIETWENESVEFKKKSTSDHELAEAIAGFATANAGRIYIGVEDDGKIVGVDGVDTGIGKDKLLRKIAHISKDLVKPPIRVKVSFIETEYGIVIRIEVPKGKDPVYYVDYRPYTRDLSTTRKLDPSEVEKLYRQHFLASFPQPDETINFLTNTLMQISDVQVIFSDYEDHLIRPDVDQMQYDLGATGRIFLELSAKQAARDMGIAEGLKELGNKLEDLEMHKFYIGKASVDEFGKKLKECNILAKKFYEQIKKRMPSSVIPNYPQVVVETIESLNNEWVKAPRYMERGEPEKLRESFRRFGYTFHRLGSLPDADKYNGLSVELREVGEKLRNLSSTSKYFLPALGLDPIEKVKEEIERVLSTLDDIKESLVE